MDYLLILCCYSQHPDYKQQTVPLFSTSRLQTRNCVVILNIPNTNNKLCCYFQHPDYKQQTVLLFATSRVQTTNCVVILNIPTTNNKLCCYSQHLDYKQQTVLLFSTSRLQKTNCVVILTVCGFRFFFTQLFSFFGEYLLLRVNLNSDYKLQCSLLIIINGIFKLNALH